jgi:hypothetical protein
MPVPVTRTARAPSHQVIKPARGFHSDTNVLPPSANRYFSASLPRSRPSRLWEDDYPSQATYGQELTSHQQGLAGVYHAPVIKGIFTQFATPPKFNGHIIPQQQLQVPPSTDRCTDPANRIPMAIDYSDLHQSGSIPQNGLSQGEAQYYQRQDDWGAFTPIFEQQSPEDESRNMSSPLEPATPFGDYVDRALTDSAAYISHESEVPYEQTASSQGSHPDQIKPQSEPTASPPSATEAYKRLALPLAEWVSGYVWKVCRTGAVISQGHVSAFQAATAAGPPPTHLASLVHSMLLSTLLQPSAVFLSLWYITRLPVFFGSVGLGADHVKELRFRVALLGDACGGMDRKAMELRAPFRLIILGCMLANKWLDDHTFSNKTWHTISGLPIQDINKLESLALDIFSYDLSVSRSQWTSLMAHLLDYHQTLRPPSHLPQPISRPSMDPHSLIRKAMDEILRTPCFHPGNLYPAGPQPIFVGLIQRKTDKLNKDAVDNAMDIDLDEDGPLRQEYVPKRRALDNIYRSSGPYDVPSSTTWTWKPNVILPAKGILPVPSKWSPAEDEPLLRNHPLDCSYYPSLQPLYAPCPNRHQEAGRDFVGHGLCWSTSCDAMVPKACTASSLWETAAPALHSRSHSLNYDRGETALHYRSYSQSYSEFKCSDIRSTVNEVPVHSNAWPLALPYTYQPVYAPHGGPFAYSWARA